MQTLRPMLPRERAQRQPSKAEAAGRTTTATPSLGWGQRLAQLWARPRRRYGPPRALRCVDHGEAHHAPVPPWIAEHPLDLVAMTGGYDLRMALYHLMLS